MKETEILMLFARIRSNYSNFENTRERLKEWERLFTIAGLDLDTAMKNLDLHMIQNEFPPNAAQIIRYDPDQFTDYEKLQLETQQRFKEIEEWEQQAIPLPEHLRPKSLKDVGEEDG